MNGNTLTLGLVGALALAGAVRRRGGANTGREIFVTTLTGDEVFGHVTTRAGAEAIQRQGFRVGEGKYGTGVYLLSPEEEWGGGLPPTATSAHAFRLRWHEGRTDLRVLRVSLPAGTRLLRVVASPGEATLEAMKVLHGDAEGTERGRAAWRQGQEEAVLHADLRAAEIDGVYWVDPVWNADEILVLDPARLSVVREQVQEGSAARIDPALAHKAWNALPAGVRMDIEVFQAGVLVGKTPALEAQLTHAEPAVERAMRPIREAVSALGGVRLYRGEPATVHPVPRAWLSWTDDQRMAQQFAGPKGKVRVREVGPEEIVAVFPHGEAMEWLIREPTGSAARTVHRTDPALWERVKAEVTASDTGGRPGQWSARKAQRAVQLYTARGGGYLGSKDPDNALARWTQQDWHTRSGGESLETGERYLPAAAFDLLTPAEVGATTRAKRAGLARGQQFTPQPPRIAQKTKQAREGAANVIAPSGYDQTAMARTGPSAPVQHLRAHAPELLRGRLLDFGSGRGADAKALRATPYDPHHPKAAVRKRPTGTFDTVLGIYVLNVLPKAERHAALREAASYVKRGGHLVLAVRPQAEVAATVTHWSRNGDGHQLVGEDGARDRFQRGYTPDQLDREVHAVLGAGFAPVPLPALSGSVVGVWRRA